MGILVDGKWTTQDLVRTDPEQVKHHHLEDAVSAVLKGEKPATAETTSIGCRIRYASDRRKKS